MAVREDAVAYKAAGVLAALAFGLCVFLTVHSLYGMAMPGCSSGSGCESVLSGRWSVLSGFLPVAALGAGLYLALLICLLLRLLGRDPGMEGLVSGALTLFASALLSASLWFIVLQFWKVKAVCPWCMCTHALGIIISVILLLRLRPLRRTAVLAGVAATVLLALLQLFTVPSGRYAEGAVGSGSLPIASPADFPVIGDPSAPNTVEVLFDYQCPHCRELHALLPEIAAQKDVAFVLCPTPLSPACNAYLPPGEDRFKGSCELTSMALAIWLNHPEAFPGFDSWLFADDASGRWKPRRVEDARAKAEELIGAEELARCLGDKRIRERLGITLEIFGRTTAKGRSGIPRLVYGQSWLVPEALTAGELSGMISEAFGI